MTASPLFLEILVTAATLGVSLAPLVLLGIWLRDARKRRLW